MYRLHIISVLKPPTHGSRFSKRELKGNGTVIHHTDPVGACHTSVLNFWFKDGPILPLVYFILSFSRLYRLRCYFCVTVTIVCLFTDKIKMKFLVFVSVKRLSTIILKLVWRMFLFCFLFTCNKIKTISNGLLLSL